MDDISALIQEAKPLYFARKQRHKQIRNFCAALFLVFGFSFIYQPNNSYIYDFDNLDNELSLTQNGSIIEDMGLPTDDFGLLKVI